MTTLRTDETKAAYDAYKLQDGFKNACPLCVAPVLKTFTYWKIIANAYPYDRIAQVHHMILPVRHVTEAEVTKDEWQEYQTIKRGYIQKEYEFILETTNQMKTIPAHLHQHLIVLKD